MTFSNSGDPTRAGFRLQTSPFYLMTHADFKFHEDMEVILSKKGVDRSIYRILAILNEEQPASIGRIAEISLLKRTTVSRIIDRMIERDLAETRPNAEDHRITEVRMTERGYSILVAMTPIVARQFQRAINGIDDQDLGIMIRTLQQIITNLNRLAIE